MPELPEMQALTERIGAAVGGAELLAISPLSFQSLKTVAPAPETLLGRRMERTARRGKYALLDFGGPRIAFHLSQGGRVDLEEPPKKTRPKGAIVRFEFGGESRRALLLKEYGTERKAGWWVLAEGDEGPLAGLGPEPDSDEFAELILRGDDRRRLHTMLRDQRTVAGLGRGYTDDLLHRAQLSPFATLAGLDAATRERLLAIVREVLEEGLAHERRREGGLPTKLGDHWVVHKRHGNPCPVCDDTLQRVSYESYEVTYCPTCQTGGKIHADRRLSRLLK